MTKQMEEQMGALIGEMTQAGVLIQTGGWDPTSPCTVVKATSDGEMRVIDGPYAETKEVVAGFAIIEVKNKAEAVAWTKRFLAVAGEGSSEVRAI
jgi:hypothetical protein